MLFSVWTPPAEHWDQRRMIATEYVGQRDGIDTHCDNMEVNSCRKPYVGRSRYARRIFTSADLVVCILFHGGSYLAYLLSDECAVDLAEVPCMEPYNADVELLQR